MSREKMRVLLVEPDYRRLSASRRRLLSECPAHEETPQHPSRADDTLWYPPLALMKLSRFHKNRGDEVKFVSGCDNSLFDEAPLFSPRSRLWDRVYITTLFTFHYDQIIRTVKFYKEAVGGTSGKVFVGGIMASLMAKAIFEETGIYPITGTLTSPHQIGLDGDVNIDMITPDYMLLNRRLYAINDTYYAYTSRGCINRCKWCGVPQLEPTYVPYIDIKPMILEARDRYGDKARLRLMDNNVLASPQLSKIIDDLLELGYGREEFTATTPKKHRVVDFNQGLDASFITEDRIRLLSQLNIKPMRIAFDRVSEGKTYRRAITLAHKHGVTQFSNYMLYNWKDTPKDLYERLVVNIEFNEKWAGPNGSPSSAEIYSYPMRYAPIDESAGLGTNRKRDYCASSARRPGDMIRSAFWTKRFIRNIEIMKGAAHGAISPTPTLARRTIGETYEEFVANLYMPEELLRNRNKHERYVYPHEPKRRQGTGKVEEFRAFILFLIKQGGKRFREFHAVVSQNSAEAIRTYLSKCNDKEMCAWLRLYLKK